MIYLDNAATTYPKPKIFYDSVEDAFKNYSFNSGRGAYTKAQEVSKVIEDTRKKIAKIAGSQNYNNVVFTPSATASLNQIITGFQYNRGINVYVTPFEHNSIIRPLNYMKEKYDFNIIEIPFNKDTWELEEEELIKLFENNTPTYVFMSHVSNVSGYILPVSTITNLAKKYDAVTIVDAAQSFSTVKLNINENKVDYLVFAGHKSLYGPFGIAGFIVNTNNKLDVNFSGGTGSDTMNYMMPEELPQRHEAGSPNSSAIYLLNKSLDFVMNNNVYEKKKELTDYLIEKLRDLINVELYLPEDINKCEGIVSFNVDGYLPDEVGKILNDEFDIAVRTGFHCAPRIHEFIGTKDKMGTVRVSLGFFNTKEEIDKLVEAIETL